MDKVIVAYWSQTGNTAAMAAAIGEGITEAGKEAVVTDISSVSMDDLQAASAFALGCPAMGAEVLEEGEMEPLDRKSTRLNSSHSARSRMPSSA